MVACATESLKDLRLICDVPKGEHNPELGELSSEREQRIGLPQDLRTFEIEIDNSEGAFQRLLKYAPHFFNTLTHITFRTVLTPSAFNDDRPYPELTAFMFLEHFEILAPLRVWDSRKELERGEKSLQLVYDWADDQLYQLEATNILSLAIISPSRAPPERLVSSARRLNVILKNISSFDAECEESFDPLSSSDASDGSISSDEEVCESPLRARFSLNLSCILS